MGYKTKKNHGMHQNTFQCCYGDCVTTNQQTKIIKSCWRDLPLYHATLFSKNLYLMPAIFLFFSANNSFYKIMKNASFFFIEKSLFFAKEFKFLCFLLLFFSRMSVITQEDNGKEDKS